MRAAVSAFCLFWLGAAEVSAETLTGNVFLQGNYVEVGIHPSGSFGSNVSPPAGFHARSGGAAGLGFVADVGKDGWNVGTPNYIGDYFVPGSPEEGWCVEWSSPGGGEHTFGNFGLNNSFQIPATSLTETSSGDTRSAVWTGTATNGSESLQVTQTVHYKVNDLFFVISVTLVNTGTTTINSVEYMRNVDPDQEAVSTSQYTTSNYVTNNDATGQRLVVGKGLTYASICGLGTIDSRAVVSTEGFTNRDPDAILDSPQTPPSSSPAVADQAIALAYRFGSLAPGQSVSFDYAYILKESDLAVALGNFAAVSILQPTGTVSGSNVIFQATTDNTAATTQMEFFVNGTSIGVDSTPDGGGLFQTVFDSSAYSNGNLNLKVVATFTGGSTVEKSSTVTVGNSGPPVSFAAPVAGSGFRGSGIPVLINVLDDSHPPVRVSFFRETASTGSVLLGEDTSSPFGTTFSVVGLPPGETVIIKAVAADNLNRLTTIQVSGVAWPQEIGLKGNGMDIANGDVTPSLTDHTDFGTALASSGSAVRTYTITNGGGAVLHLTGTPLVALSGPGASAFNVTTAPASATVSAGGGTRTFQITFDPASAGIHTATVSIRSDDAGHDPFTFDISGTGAAPEIAVEQPTGIANGIASGGGRDFEVVHVGASSAARSFTIRNTGDASLAISAISKVGTGAGDFTLASPATPLSLAPGEFTIFDVAFVPVAGGPRSASIRIESNDADEGVFEVKLSGSGNAVPSLTLPGSPLVAEATSAAGTIVALMASATDAEDEVLPVTLSAPGIIVMPGGPSLPPSAAFPMGDTTVSASSTDSNGATTTGSFTVRVRDTTAPAVTVPGNIVVEAAGMSGRVVTFSPSATDAVGGVSLTSTPASGSLFPIGQTQVQVTATDAAGNTGSGTFTVTVSDGMAPVVTVPDNIGPIEATGPSGAIVTYLAQATDTVGVKSITYSRGSGVFFPIGITTVTVTATDNAGNSGSASFTVTVRDTTPPVITPPADVELTSTSENGRRLTFTTGWAADLVDGLVDVTYSPDTGTEFPIGRTLVTVRAEDAEHNVSTATFVVTITPSMDDVAPVVKLTSPSSNPTGSPITIAGTVKDNYGLNYLRVKLNGEPVQLDAPLEKPLSVDFPRGIEKNWLVSGVVPENGMNFIEVEAQDLRGLVTTVTKTFTLWRQRPGLAGVYPALVKPEGTPGVATSGLVTLTVLNTGAFSGKVMVNGAEIPVMGVLSNDGTGMLRGASGNTEALPLVTVERILLKKVAGTTMRTVTRQHGTLSLQVSEGNGLSGVLTDGAGPEPEVLASFSGKKAPYSKANTVAAGLLNLPAGAQGAAKGYYTVALAPGSPADVDDGEGLGGGGVSFVLPPSPVRPPGDGYATLTLNGSGSALLAGYLADGTSWTAGALLRSDGTLAVFSPLYGKRGGVAGEVKFDLDQQNSDVGGNGFLWIRPVQPAALQYVVGWPHGVYLDAAGAKFTGGPAALSVGQGPVDSVLGNVRLVFTDGLLSAPVMRRANVDAATGVVTKVPETTLDYTLQVSSTSGVISGTFQHTDGTVVGYRGTVLTKGANRGGFGYFLSNGDGGEGGWFTLEASLPD